MTINGISKSFNLQPGAGGEISSSATISPGETWQLASGHWVTRKFDMDIAHPRPDTETNTYAQHRNAYPGVAWNTRILVYGGAYPFHFELVTGPSGMTIGQDLTASSDVLIEGATYGKLSWATPTAGSHTVTVRVFDQDYQRASNASEYKEITWTLEVGSDNWVVIDPVGGSNANAGTLASPFADTTPFITGSTYAGKCVLIRAGTMNLVGMSSSNYTFDGNQPGVFVGYPGETATINFNTGHFTVQAGDFCLQGLTLSHDAVGYGNSQKMVSCNANGAHRAGMVDCVVTNYNIGTSTAGNGGVFVSVNDAVALNYLYFAYNELTGNQGPGFHSYDCYRAVVHGNNWHDCTLNGFDGSTHGLIFFKEYCTGASVRKNVAWSALSGTGEDRIFGFSGQIDTGDVYGVQYLEWCYNTFYKTGYTLREATFREYTNDSAHGDIDNYHFYRNTFGNKNNAEVGTHAVTNSTREYNILEGGTFDPMGTADSNNQEGTGLINTATMALTGANRTAYLGTHGAEVA